MAEPLPPPPGLSLGGLLPLGLGVHVVDEGRQLPDLQREGVGPGEAEAVGDEGQVDYSSPSVGSAGVASVEIFRAPAISQVKSGFSRRLEM